MKGGKLEYLEGKGWTPYYKSKDGQNIYEIPGDNKPPRLRTAWEYAQHEANILNMLKIKKFVRPFDKIYTKLNGENTKSVLDHLTRAIELRESLLASHADNDANHIKYKKYLQTVKENIETQNYPKENRMERERASDKENQENQRSRSRSFVNSPYDFPSLQRLSLNARGIRKKTKTKAKKAKKAKTKKAKKAKRRH